MNFLNRLSQRASFKLILFLPVIFYLAVALFWQYRHLYQITGDEPHYLVITDSLVRDQDLLIDNNYSMETPVQKAIGLNLAEPEHQITHVRGRYSVHNIGLPLLLAIPYSLAGVYGAKVFLSLLAGLWPLLFYKALLHVTESRHWSVIITVTLSIGLPFAAGSSQIYPDLAAGMIIFGVTFKVFEKLQSKNAPSHSWPTDLLIGLMIGFLPWLHIRFSAPAFILLAAYTYFSARSPTRTPWKIFRTFVPAILVIGSLGCLAIYHQIAFGNPLGPYQTGSLGNNFATVMMIVLGLHADQSHGMFMQQPLLLLGLVGIVPLIKYEWRGALLLLILYLSILLPNAMHPTLYGGFSFLGRFGWAVVALWVFPVAFAVRLFLQENRWPLKLLCIGAVSLQGLFAAKWVFDSGFLLGQKFHYWSSRGFYEDSGLSPSLPVFRHLEDYLRYPPNYVFLTLGIGLIITGALWQRGAKRLALKIWVAFLVVGISVLMLLPPEMGSWKIVAAALPSKIGVFEGHYRVATEYDGAGYLIFGPHTPLLAGIYEVTLEYDAIGPANVEVARFDIIHGPQLTVVTDVALPPSATNDGKYRYVFLVHRKQSLITPFEFRVKYGGRGYLKVKQVTITPKSFTKI